MFTGIIQAVGTIEAVTPRGGDVRLRVATGKLPLDEVGLGDSIAVSGVCLTAVELAERTFAADVSRETLSKTTLGKAWVGSPVNLELAMTPTTRFGGHIVSGHVDGIGEVIAKWDDGRSVRFRIRAPRQLARYIASKGSICVDGISLTVNQVDGADFEVNIVPHTLQETTLGTTTVGDRVNLEVDLIARYLERLLLGDGAGGGLQDLLQRSGFTHP
ncbi:riboflavin synthase [Methylomarinovum caldicuralii]|uniref:Riboflavin synthase n=1 Tax=Methylomarinovum caldicuralii TaxID=438856 RepID=A0AAU9CJL5_9GAMM|nr:riboflavin synthase [Methylomarinovum caldicuralii]BCX81811.1 riboflavin synthase [Methylomarinovum caldicuralii]